MKISKICARNLAILLLMFAGVFSMASCNESDEPAVVPVNWISIADDAFVTTYEGGTYSRAFTVPAGVNPSCVYVVSQATWARASVENGSEVVVKVDASTSVEERSTIVTLVYDMEHQFDIAVEQGAAPPAKVETISVDASLKGMTIPMGQGLDLNPFVTVLPANAGDKTIVFSSSNPAVATVENGVIRGLSAGTVTITITAVDGGGAKTTFNMIVGDVPFDRTGWTATTSIVYANGQNYVTDGTTGKPEDIFDGDAATYLSLIKPGKSMSGYATPADHQLYFIVDMGAVNTFNYVVWGHRSTNTYDYLRVWECTVLGSNDGENFTEITTGLKVHTVRESLSETVDIPEATCRYIKVIYTSWSTASGSSMQIAEFNVGKK